MSDNASGCPRLFDLTLLDYISSENVVVVSSRVKRLRMNVQTELNVDGTYCLYSHTVNLNTSPLLQA
jgi:hypothetical protein